MTSLSVCITIRVCILRQQVRLAVSKRVHGVLGGESYRFWYASRAAAAPASLIMNGDQPSNSHMSWLSSRPSWRSDMCRLARWRKSFRATICAVSSLTAHPRFHSRPAASNLALISSNRHMASTSTTRVHRGVSLGNHFRAATGRNTLTSISNNNNRRCRSRRGQHHHSLATRYSWCPTTGSCGCRCSFRHNPSNNPCSHRSYRCNSCRNSSCRHRWRSRPRGSSMRSSVCLLGTSRSPIL